MPEEAPEATLRNVLGHFDTRRAPLVMARLVRDKPGHDQRDDGYKMPQPSLVAGQYPARSSTAWPRFGTSTVRSKLMNWVPSALRPVVRTVTMPWVGRFADSRFAKTSDSA